MKPVFFQTGSVCVAFAALSALLPVAAAEPSIKFKVAEKQLQALGIQVAPIARAGESTPASFPAQVILSPDREQVVSSPLAGLIVQVLVQLNQPVRQGTALLRIVAPELGQQQLQLMQAASRLALARQTANREQALWDAGIIPQRRVQESQAAMKEAEATFAQTRASLRLSGMPDATIARVAAGGKLEDSITLAAPRSGVVTRLDAKPGQRIEPAAALLQIAETDKLSLDILVPAAEAGRWKPGAKVKVQGRDARARVVSSSAVVAPGSQTVSIRAAVEGAMGSLRAGESVAVEMPGTAGAGWELPLGAVAHDGAQTYVFVKNADGFEARSVTVAASAGQKVTVQGAFNGGEQVAIGGVVALKGAWLEEKAKGSK